MICNFYRAIRWRSWSLKNVIAVLVTLGLVLNQMPSMLAQSNSESNQSNKVFLPLLSQSDRAAQVVDAALTSGQRCYIGTNNPALVSAEQSWTVDSTARTVTIFTMLAKSFVDNTYGTGAVGWSKGHKFNDLTGSDQVQLALYDANGVNRLEFKIDYLSASGSAPSGYGTLGISGGDGKLVSGNAAYVLGALTSLDVNFNQYGYVLTTNSPATNANYTANPQYPNWIYDVWYEATVSLDAFGAAGFGYPSITGVHASPSKTGNNTEPVSETPCPTPPTPTNTPGGPTPTPTATPGVPTPTATRSVTSGQRCYIGTNNPALVSAEQSWTVDSTARTVTIFTMLAKSFVDNTYGTGAVGWSKGHKFNDLTGSDQVQLALYDANGVNRLEFKIDYLSASGSAPSGYGTLGISGGDGKLVSGNAAYVLGALTSLDVNFNQYGYVLTTNSPATNANYTANPQYPNWIYDVWYEATVSLDAFGAAGFGYPSITGVHASPSKTGNNTEPVSETPCPTPPTPTNTPTNTPAPLGSLGDRVWNDFNRNGIQESGEPGVPNVTVQLKDCSGNTLQATVTDANGIYHFNNLPAGCYSVGVVLPPGFQFSPQDQGGNDNTDSDINPGTATTGSVNLGPGQNIDNVDAGINQPPANTPTNTPAPLGSLGDRVWNDTNRNGIQDTNEPGVDGVEVRLLDCNRNPLATATTANGGSYQFTNLNAGCYIVRFVNINSNNFVFTAPNQGANDAVDSDVVNLDSVTPGIVNGETAPINLATGENNPTIDAGIYSPPTPTPTATKTNVPSTATPTNTSVSYNSSLGDQIWNDLNRNGNQDSGEPYLPGLTVRLLQGCSGSTILATATTDANGWFTFYGLAAGQYRLQFVLPTGYQFTLKQQGASSSTDSNANPDGTTDCVTLTAGQNDTTWDAGIYSAPTPTATNTSVPPTSTPTKTNVPPTPTPTTTSVSYNSSLGDQIWNDLNRNGNQDSGEPYLPSLTVRLLQGCSGNTILATATTDANGWFTFYGLAAGQYRLQFVLPTGYQFTLKQQGASSSTDSNANLDGTTDCITLTAGQNDTTWDAGIYPTTSPTPTPTGTPPQLDSSLGDQIWNDLNRNGNQDSGEPYLPSLTVRLLQGCSGSTVLANIITDVNGWFTFYGLAAGQYRLQFVLPTGYQFTLKQQGTSSSTDSNANPDGTTDCITLTAGQNDTTWDAGIYQTTVPTPTPTNTPGGSNTAVGDRVWDDLNKNGIQDNGEPGLPGVKVALYNSTTGTLLFAQQTDANGVFLFTNLTPGSYYICFQPPAAPPIYVVTAMLQGPDRNLDNNADPATGCTTPFTLSAGQTDRSIDGGFYDPPAVFGIGSARLNVGRTYLPLVVR